MGDPVLYYWPILARNVIPTLVAAAAGLKLTLVEPDWPAFKSSTHFGQLPMLDLGGLRVSQSLAIARVLARRGGLAGATEADFALSEMLYQEAEDIYSALASAMYGPDHPASRPAAFGAFFAPAGPAARHLGHLEALATPSGDFTEGRTGGEAAIAGILYILADLEPAASLLAATPKLKAFYDKRGPAAASVLAGLRPYFSRTAVKGPDE